MFTQGQTIGPYTLISRLGKGGFGDVWLAEKRSQFLSKRVALKLPHDEQVDLKTIEREARLWEAASGHPNVLPIIDAEVYDGQVVIVSEYADGGSLADRLKDVGTTSHKHAVELTIGILTGLEFLHNRQIIHRDIKPQNILLQGDTPRLADFGISRAMQTTAVSSTIIGTDSYMSPEAFDGKRSVQTDIWSVGVVLYQLLNGTLPFPQEHPSERLFAVLTKNFEPLDPSIPIELRRVVEKALQKQPENRYASAAEMRQALASALSRSNGPTAMVTEVYDGASMATVLPPSISPPDETVLVSGAGAHPPAAYTAPDSVATRVDLVVPTQTPKPVDGTSNVSSMSMGKMVAVAAGLIFVAMVMSVIIAGLSQGRASNSNTGYSANSSNRAANTANNSSRPEMNSTSNASSVTNSISTGNTTSNSINRTSSAVVDKDATFCEGYAFGWRQTFTSKGLTVPATPTCPDPMKYREGMRDGHGGQIVGTMDAMGRINSSNSNK